MRLYSITVASSNEAAAAVHPLPKSSSFGSLKLGL